MEERIRLIGQIGLLGFHVIAATVRGRVPLGQFLERLYLVLYRCILPVMAVVLPFGMVMSLQGLQIFAVYGTQRMVSPFVAAAILRELGPVMACVLVAAQGGASFAAELGAMRIKEELDATEVMAVDSVAFHVAPRFWALVVACPVLNLLGCVSGIFGGYVSAVWLMGEPSGTYMAYLWDLLQPWDAWATVLKTTVFGMIIGAVSCFLGFNATGGAAGVGRAVNNTVVWSVLTFIVDNYLLTSAILGGVS